MPGLRQQIDSPELKNQKDFLDSGAYNQNIERLVETLAGFYTELRNLEDAQEEFKTAIEGASLEKEERLVQLLEQLESAGRGERLMPAEGKQSVFDRAGGPVHTCRSLNGVFLMPTDGMAELKPAGSVTVHSTGETVDLPDFIDRGYRISRIEETNPVEGHSESFTIEFSVPQKIDFLHIDTVRCRLEELRYGIGEDFVYEDAPENCHVKKEDVKEVSFTVRTDRYRPKDSKYLYEAEIRSVELRRGEAPQTAGLLFQEIEAPPGTHLELDADFLEFDGSVEFYLLENNRQIPILPAGQERIENEKVFPELKTRFRPNHIKDKDIGESRASYHPFSGWSYKATGAPVQPKIIMRHYQGRPSVIRQAFIRHTARSEGARQCKT